MKFLRARDQQVVPWKNGGGLTREVASGTGDKAGAGFLWRVSMATISKDGPFSEFTGIDRTIALMQGDPVLLRSDMQEVRLAKDGEPYAFNGELPVIAKLTGTGTTNLNVMTRRGHCRHSLKRLQLDENIVIEGEADETIIIFNGPAVARLAAGDFAASQFDAITGIGKEDRVMIFPQAGSEILVIRITTDPDATLI